MRVSVVVAALLAGALPCSGQEANRVVIPTPLATYSAMPLAERVAIQSDLLWAGYYDGLADGEFNERGIAAIRAFQKANKSKQTGVLNPQERNILAAEANKQRDEVSWTVVEDAPSGARIGFPATLLRRWVENTLGSRWTSEQGEAVVETFRVADGASLAAVFHQHKQVPERKVTSSQLRSDSFVMAGLQGLKKFYSRAEYKNGEVRGITVLYDQATAGTMAKLMDAVRSSFVPFWRTAVVKVAQAKGKAEYATGLVVSAEGHIVTPRHVVDGCSVVVANGLGSADVVAEDAEKGLALLRVYGKRLTPFPLPAASAAGTELTLVGMPDPKTQAATSAVTSRAKLAGASDGLRAIDGTPPPSFSGAVALDANQRFAGMVRVRTQVMAEARVAKLSPPAAVIPSTWLREFLQAQSVEPASGSAGVNDAKAAVVRVICVRT